MNEKLNNLKAKIMRTFEEHPVETIIAGSTALAAVSKAVNVVTEFQNSCTWRKEVERRRRNDLIR